MVYIIKIKNIAYEHYVQLHTSGKGLDIFSTIYKNQSSLKLNNSMAHVFYSQIKSQNIKKLEFRMGFLNDIDTLKKTLINIFNVYREMLTSNYFINKEYKAITLIGIVFHFIKQEKVNNIEKCCIGFGKITNRDLDEKYLEQAKIIAKLRREIPKLDNYIVGIDAASKKLIISPYVFKKAYEELRSYESMKTTDENNSAFVKEIGFTYHVGEDFRDIVSGLRQVDETIEELHFKSGDRIGHGIVIGINIDKWAELNPSVYIKAEEYLDNLLWEWNLYTKNREFKNIENISYLEREIYNIVDYIFGFSAGVRVIDLYECYTKKRRRECLNNKYGCELKSLLKKKYMILNNKNKDDNHIEDLNWTPQKIYNALNCYYFIKEMDKNVMINIDRDAISKYKKLQQHMKKKISNKQIILEINPTSNLVIGDFKTFEDYHVSN